MAKMTLAIAALLSLISPAAAVQIQEMSANKSELTELNRYIASNGKPINLA